MKGLLFSAIFALPLAAIAQSLPPIQADPEPVKIDATPPKWQANEPRRYPKPSETPECGCRDQCESMWAAAPGALEKASNMRLRLATETLLDTYAPTGYEGLHGRVVKRPNGHGGYQIASSFDSVRNIPVGDTALKRAETMFNMDMHAVYMGLSCPST